MFVEWNDRALASVERQPETTQLYQTHASLVGMVHSNPTVLYKCNNEIFLKREPLTWKQCSARRTELKCKSHSRRDTNQALSDSINDYMQFQSQKLIRLQFVHSMSTRHPRILNPTPSSPSRETKQARTSLHAHTYTQARAHTRTHITHTYRDPHAHMNTHTRACSMSVNWNEII